MFSLALEKEFLTCRILSDAGNEMITSRMRGKARTTVPPAVRQALGLRPGDEIVYLIESGGVTISKAAAKARMDDPFAAFEEWGSDADQRAYGNV